MEEGRVTVDGTTHPIPQPFLVIATQNPVGAHGTQLLPDSQMDRFLIRLSIGYPAPEDEITILKSNRGLASIESVQQVADAQTILTMQQERAQVYIHDWIYEYIVRLINATRSHPLIQQGASPRASLAVTKMAQAHAYLKGRDYLIPQDVQNVFSDVVAHRLILSSQAAFRNQTGQLVLGEILKSLPAPKVGRGVS